MEGRLRNKVEETIEKRVRSVFFLGGEGLAVGIFFSKIRPFIVGRPSREVDKH